jgi:hypothetical protein
MRVNKPHLQATTFSLISVILLMAAVSMVARGTMGANKLSAGDSNVGEFSFAWLEDDQAQPPVDRETFLEHFTTDTGIVLPRDAEIVSHHIGMIDQERAYGVTFRVSASAEEASRGFAAQVARGGAAPRLSEDGLAFAYSSREKRGSVAVVQYEPGGAEVTIFAVVRRVRG